MKELLVILCALVLVHARAPNPRIVEKFNLQRDDDTMQLILNDYHSQAVPLCTANVEGNWNVQTNVGDIDFEDAYEIVALEYANFQKEQHAEHFASANLDDFQDEFIKRQVKFLKQLGTAALSDEDFKKLTDVRVAMSRIYNEATICPYDEQDCTDPSWKLDKEITATMATSTNYDEMEYVWTEWHEQSGKKMKSDYVEYRDLMNAAAQANGFSDAGQMWTSVYDDPNFKDTIDDLWKEVEPLYNALHKYVKNKLGDIYGDKMDKDSDYIPAHILGNMWAQSWDNLYDRIKPYKEASVVDVTDKMKELGWDVETMFEYANEFYTSMGLEDMKMSYGPLAMIVRPDDREVACHASAWDFCDKFDFRIKMCTQVNMHDFIVVHHEMGHIQYYLQYKDQPLTLRGGANPGFHEAVGDTIALAVATPKHLIKVGLLDADYADSDEDNINALFKMALERVAFLPFGLLIDKWRWEVFDGTITEENWNTRWWALREQYQKITPPSTRGEEFFDPGAKYHIPASSQYIAYFVAHLLEFQMYKSLCIEAGEFDPNDANKPLHKCDFYQNTDAGDKLKLGLQLGTSKEWSYTLEQITGDPKISGSAILEYFRPLMVYLTRENAARDLENYNSLAPEQLNALQIAEWNVNTDVGNTDYLENLIRVTNEFAVFQREQALIFLQYDLHDIEDETDRRQIMEIQKLGTSALDVLKLTELTETISEMQEIYNTATVCPYTDQENCVTPWALDPDLAKVMSTSTDYDELLYVWQEWRDQSGKKMRDLYKTYVELNNEAAVLNNLADYGEMWREMYDDPNFENNVDRMWNEVKDLYIQLHKYVKKRLIEEYGDKIDTGNDFIPAHILGNMWAQSWVNIYDRVKPFPDASLVDVTEALESQGWTVMQMFEESDRFYKGLNLESNNMSYHPPAIIEDPEDRTIACHASAWDFFDAIDFRIKMCTSINMVDFVTVHHEMGHIQYYLQYKHLPVALRHGANPGFHEAVGDLIALSVSTPQHLIDIGLLNADDYADSEEDNINALFKMALERVAFLPFGLLIDKWRWEVFAGTVTEENWNARWWEMREYYQMVNAPVPRSEDDFDPGAKYHVPADSKYISYFIAHILEFQMHRALCITAGKYDPNVETKPLHKCDIDGSTEAGDKISAGLSLGSSRHWSEALQAMTGETEIRGDSIMEYFAPLYKFLKEENAKDLDLVKDLEDYNIEAPRRFNELVTAEWNVATDVLNNDNALELIRITNEVAQFQKDKALVFLQYDLNNIEDETQRRQVMQIQKLGTAALDSTKLTQLTETISEMQRIYNTATVCPFDDQDVCANPWTLDPDLTKVMSTSTDYDELLYVWKEWRDNSGKHMRDLYKTYVELSNEAAVLNGLDDYGEMWRQMYEDPNFIENVDRMWNEVKDLYDQLHRYVKNKLVLIYEDKIDTTNDFIPAHVLGNMWAQSWVNIYERVKPFPNASLVDVTQALEDQDWTALKMFVESDRFYMDLGLEPNYMSYQPPSIIEDPDDRTIACHASAWDFYEDADFRIKMCTSINMEDFVTVHHEMGHIQYFIQYKNLPVTLRDGANPGFHEAVGDLIALSVSTPQHLIDIGLLNAEDYADSEEDNINALFKMALERVAFLPFGLLIDKWRWEVFAGTVTEENWNARWWEMREYYQKVNSPVPRSEDDFDPGAKFHVPADSKYISYFIAHILEFQMHRALCITAGQYDPNDVTKPLHKCDIDGSTDAGDKISAGLSLGSSRHWSEALQAMTGETEISGDSLMEYFAPLYKFLKSENIAMDLKTFNRDAPEKLNELVNAEWNVATDVNNQAAADELVRVINEYADFQKQQAIVFQLYNLDDIEDETDRRQIAQLQKMGTAALSVEKLTELTETISEMQKIYNTATVCPFDDQDDCANPWTLDPDLTRVMSTSTNYDELLYAWKMWRENSGKKMRDLYQKYVNISNEAAVLNGLTDYGEMWKEMYEDPNFEENVDRMWDEVSDLYNQLHLYVKRKLVAIYGNKIDVDKEYIPAHILGNMWAQSWVNIFDRVKPFPNASLVDVTEALVKQDWTALKMFEESDRFYKDLGLEPNYMSYQPPAIIEDPEDRTIACHASAWDFYDALDFRVKMCTSINMEDFVTVHHEMGHIQYYLQYKHLPVALRDGANPGFHEAVGDLIALSVSTPQHLIDIGLLNAEDYTDSEEDNINALFQMALERVAFLPFGLLIDKWRWEVFAGTTTEQSWNARWWELRQKYQKVDAPILRYESDFDPGAKFHVPADSKYISYFIAHILEFQMHRALCVTAGKYDPNDETKPLHKCDIDGSTDAGDKIKAGLSLGSSRHWSEALQAMTGETEISGEAIMEYFAPLYKFLKAENDKENPATPQNEDSDIPAIVGGVIGGALLVGCVGYGAYYLKYKRTTTV